MQQEYQQALGERRPAAQAQEERQHEQAAQHQTDGQSGLVAQRGLAACRHEPEQERDKPEEYADPGRHGIRRKVFLSQQPADLQTIPQALRAQAAHQGTTVL